MGYSVAAAIGASMGSNNSQIISIIGDGSMQMNIQELENIKFHNRKKIKCLFLTINL